MTNTIEKALSPVFLIASFLGFEILKYSLNQSRYSFSILYILIVWSVYAYALYYMIFLFSPERVFNSYFTIFMIIANLIVIVISIIITICEHEKYWQNIKKLDLVDDTLEKVGIPKEYHKIRNSTRKVLILWFLMICATLIVDSSFYIKIYNDIRVILIPFILYYPVYVNCIMDIIFILLLRHIDNRLNKINSHIEQLSETEDYGYKWKKLLVVNGCCIRNAENRKHILWIIIHLHWELCRTAHNINDFFGIQMTLQMISYFVGLISVFYFEYYTILHFKEMYNTNMTINIFFTTNTWFIVFLMRFIPLNHICESVSIKAQNTKNIIHKLTNVICFAEVREEIYQFVLQISLRPLKFNGCGLFYFGYNFIRKFFIWGLTTIIFVVQLDFIPGWIKTYSKDNKTYYNK